jgi:hypothetical protein
MAEDTNRNPNPPSRGAAGSVYFPLFQHMADNHGLTLLDSEDVMVTINVGIARSRWPFPGL